MMIAGHHAGSDATQTPKNGGAGMRLKKAQRAATKPKKGD